LGQPLYRIAGNRVEQYFEQHPGDFDSARTARFEVAEESKAVRWSSKSAPAGWKSMG
jgi:hypothetical protein